MSAQNNSDLVKNLPQALIIGAAGYIGSSLCESLLEKNLEVIGLDNLATGHLDYLTHLKKYPKFKFIKEDLLKYTFPEEIKPDYIFHLAGIEEYINGLDVSFETLLINSSGTYKILELARKNNSRLLIASCFSIYEGLIGNYSLNYDFGLTQSNKQKYTHHEAKRFSEALTSEYFRKYNLNVRIVRIKDVYGPKMPLATGNPLAKMLKSALHENQIELEGDGLELINPTFLDDLIEGIKKAIFMPQTEGKIFSLVNPKQYTLLSIAFLLQKMLGRKIEIKFLPSLDLFKFPQKNIDLEKTLKELNWQPQTSPEEGLKKTLDYFTNTSSFLKSQTNENFSPDSFFNRHLSEEKEPLSNQNQEETSLKNFKKEKTTSSPEILKMPNKNLETTHDLNLGKKPSNFKPSNSSLTPRPIKLPKRKRLFFSALSFLLVFLIYPLFLLIFQFFFAFHKLDQSLNLLKEGNFEKSFSAGQISQKFFLSAQKNLQSQNWLFSIFKLRKLKSDLINSLQIGESASKIVVAASQTSKNLLYLVEGLSYGFSETSPSKIIQLPLEIKDIQKELSLISALYKSNSSFCPLIFHSCRLLQNKIATLSFYKKQLTPFIFILEKIPELLGKKSIVKYLILLQNNMEQRGSGGFIGSVALLVLENGKIIDFKVQDVYSLDGQLKGKVTPPEEILHFLGQPNLYLRDSNYSPDFAQNAQRAAWFFEKETGILVNGVIAIDLNFIQKILDKIGPVKMPDYQTEVNSQNLFAIAQTQAEKNFFPGSTQKKDFLESLSIALLNKITSSSQSKLILPLFSSIYESALEKHLFFYFSEPSLQTLFEELNLTGTLNIPLCLNSPNCVKAYSLITENNYGANKANFFITRNLSRKITLDREGKIIENLKIKYQNQSPTQTWPGGLYKNYLKVYAPPNSQLLNFSLGDSRKSTLSAVLNEEVLKSIKKDEFLIIESSESGKKVWQILIEVPIQKSQEIEITYQLKERLSFDQKSPRLEIYQQKQGGGQNDPFTLWVEFPSFLTLEKTEPSEKPVANKPFINYNTTLSTDQKFILSFK